MNSFREVFMRVWRIRVLIGLGLVIGSAATRAASGGDAAGASAALPGLLTADTTAAEALSPSEAIVDPLLDRLAGPASNRFT